MNFEKGRAKPAYDELPDTVETRLMQLAEMRVEMRQRRKEFRDSTKHLRESIKSLENIITEEVMKAKRTVTVGNIKAEYVPQVVFRMKKEQEQNDGE